MDLTFAILSGIEKIILLRSNKKYTIKVPVQVQNNFLITLNFIYFKTKTY